MKNFKDCYSIVSDEKEVKRFVSKLPKLNDGEVFYMTLMANKKYDKNDVLGTEKCILKRAYCSPKDILNILKKWEVEKGLYTYDGVEITNDMLSVHIKPNPRSLGMLYLKLIPKFNAILDSGVFPKPNNIITNFLSNSKSKRDTNLYVYHFDTVDEKSKQICMIEFCEENYLPYGSFEIIVSSNGFYVVFDIKKLDKEYFEVYDMIMTQFADNYQKHIIKYKKESDGYIPFVGTYQNENEVELY